MGRTTAAVGQALAALAGPPGAGAGVGSEEARGGSDPGEARGRRPESWGMAGALNHAGSGWARDG